MGGTDLIDQMIAYYFNNNKAYKWQVRIFTFGLYASLTNAHILYKKFCMHGIRESVKKKLPGNTLLSFMQMLMKDWITAELWDAIMARNKGNTVYQSRGTDGKFVQSPPQLRIIREVHLPRKKYGQHKGADGNIHDNRRNCLECGAKTPLVCSKCESEPPLCFFSIGNNNCAEKYHSKLES